MVTIGNNIKVLLTKYSEDVIIDDIGGELLLYNHSHLCGFTDQTTISLLKDYRFTGVSLEYLENVMKMEIKNFYDESLDFFIHLNYIFVKQQGAELDDPICVVSFVPKSSSWIGAQFYANFIEKTN